MSSQPLRVGSDPISPDWQEIEDLLDQIAQVSKSTAFEDELYRLLLDRIVPALAASGAAVWTRAGDGALRLAYQINLVEGPTGRTREALAGHLSVVEGVLRAGQPRVAPPRSGSANDDLAGNPTDSWLACYPFQAGPQSGGVIELVQRRPMTASEGRGYLRLLAAVVELVNDFHRDRELRQLRQHESQWRDYDLFARQVHRSLDVDQTVYSIANDGRRIIGCDRVSVMICNKTACRALAVSGVDALDRRAKIVQLLERLTTRAVASHDPIWYCDGATDIPEEIASPLAAYLDESHARVVAIVPLFEPRTEADNRAPRVIGALVAERFQASPSDAELRDRVAAIAGHSAVALANALAHTRLPLAAVGRALARVRLLAEARQLPKTAIALAAIAAAVAGLTFVPADFMIEARGELQPERRRDVFATDDGVVSELLVDHGQTLRAAAPLVVIRKPQLDLELSRVAGEIQTAEKKLAAVQAERLENAPPGTVPRRGAHQLTADEEELKEQVKGLREQREIIERERADLVVRSPIDGQALTWNLKKLLESRPVERGQALLTVGDLDGPWVLELHVPDHRAGHVLQAREEMQRGQEVSFALASEPGTVYRGRVTDVAMSTELDEAATPTLLVTVGIDRNEVAGLRPGATVIAQIDCGRRSVGYVWLHDLFEFVQSHWWW